MVEPNPDKRAFFEKRLPELRRKCFDHLKAYVPGEQPQDIEKWIKLNTNENPYMPPESVIERLKEDFSAHLRMYPDPKARILKEKILKNYISSLNLSWYGKPGEMILDVNNISVANGSDEMLDILFKTFIEPGDNVLFFKPSYGMYSVLADSYEAVKVIIPLKAGSFEIPNTLPEFSERDKLLLICSPNNPNGGIISLDKLEGLLVKFPGVIFVDEAYADFSGQTALEILPKHPNLIVGKTFSKSFGMASIRLGFAIAHKEIISLFETIRLPYNVSYFAQVAGSAALDALDDIKANIDRIISERQRVSDEITSFIREISGRLNRNIDIGVLPSYANFILIEFPDRKFASEVFNGLKKRKILVRYWSNQDLERYIRVTIGTPEQNKIFLKAFSEIVNEILQ